MERSYQKEANSECQKGMSWNYFLSREVKKDFLEFLNNGFQAELSMYEQEWAKDCRVLIFIYSFHFTLRYFPPQQKLVINFKVLIPPKDREPLLQTLEKVLDLYCE